ncbi:cation:proton antiporter, partial [Streptomyces europaeiscabiei]|nr:cation:proton antiporter [Streptomyces europaeiscabiei]MDX3876555.1 cation:proton antiporter [Streptomyces europaeiscabiei]
MYASAQAAAQSAGQSAAQFLAQSSTTHSSAVFLVEFGAIILGLGLLGRFAGRFRLSPIPLYLLAGLAFGEGGLLPLGTSEEFVAIGAEIG